MKKISKILISSAAFCIGFAHYMCAETETDGQKKHFAYPDSLKPQTATISGTIYASDMYKENQPAGAPKNWDHVQFTVPETYKTTASYSGQGLSWQTQTNVGSGSVGLVFNGLNLRNAEHFSDIFSESWQVALKRAPKLPPPYSLVLPDRNVKAVFDVKRKELDDYYGQVFSSRMARAEHISSYAARDPWGTWMNPYFAFAEKPHEVAGNVDREKAHAIDILKQEFQAKHQQELAHERDELDTLIKNLEAKNVIAEQNLVEQRAKADKLRDEFKQKLLIKDLEMRLSAAQQLLSDHAPTYTAEDGQKIVNLQSLENRFSGAMDRIEDAQLEEKFTQKSMSSADVADAIDPENVAHNPDPNLVHSPIFNDEPNGTYQASWDRHEVGENESVYVATYEQTSFGDDNIEARLADNQMYFGTQTLTNGYEYQGVFEDNGADDGDESRSWVASAKHFVVDAVFNVDSIREGYAYIASTRSTDPWVTKFVGLPVAGMMIVGGVVDAATNVATLGVKSLASATRKGLVQGSKMAIEKWVAKNAAGEVLKVENVAARSFKSVGGGEKVLSKTLINEARKKGAQVHHVVPQMKEFSEHELVKLAGYDVEASYNKMLLPNSKKSFASTRTIHRGPPNAEAKERLRRAMNEARDRGLAEGWTQAQFKEKLMKIVHEERKGLRSGKFPLDNAQ